MLFKIAQIGDPKYKGIGMVEVTGSFYLEEGDDGWEKYKSEQYVEIIAGKDMVWTLAANPLNPDDLILSDLFDYESMKLIQGKDYTINGRGITTINKYKEGQLRAHYYPDKLPKDGKIIWKLNPFCNHSIQFEPNVTEQEVAYCMQLALEMTAQNYLKDDLFCKVDGVTVNKIDKEGNPVDEQGATLTSRFAYYEGIKQISVELQTAKMKTDIAKVATADTKAIYLKTVDFVKVGK